MAGVQVVPQGMRGASVMDTSGDKSGDNLGTLAVVRRSFPVFRTVINKAKLLEIRVG